MINKLALFLITSFLNLSLVYAAASNSSSMQNATADLSNNAASAKLEAAAILDISNIRARAANSKNSALYFVVQNKSNQDVVILGASCPEIANKVELHDIVSKPNGSMEMKKLDKVLVPVNATIEFKPRSLHVMLMDLKKELKDGDKCACVLRTNKGDQKIEIDVKKNVD